MATGNTAMGNTSGNTAIGNTPTRNTATRNPQADVQPASPDEVERMMRNLCAYALSEPDPIQRYLNLTHQQAVFAGVAAALLVERGKALADVAESGVPLEGIVRRAGLTTPTQVRSLVKAAGRKLPTSRGKAAAKTPAKTTAKAMPMLPLSVRATSGSRVLTADERLALGLPVAGSINTARKRSTTRSATPKATTPKTATPKTAVPKTATSKTATPKTATTSSSASKPTATKAESRAKAATTREQPQVKAKPKTLLGSRWADRKR